MERLTKRINGVATYIGKENSCDTGQIPAELNVVARREILERLAAYEDTGLSPQACVEAREIEAGLSAEDYSIHRMVELMRADKDGRLAVLPCKVGDTVYVINVCKGMVFECTVISISVGRGTDLKNYLKTRWVGPRGNESIRKWTLRQVGRYVFLTREEAEKALEGRK